MSADKLAALLKCEDDRVEWKRAAREKDDILHAVCALANDLGNSQRPGYLLIGVEPKTGQVVGLGPRDQTLDEEQQKLSSRLRSGKLWPMPAMDVQIAEVDGKTLFVVQIDPYPVPPVVTVDGVPWVRCGATTVRATEADQVRLRERRPLHHQPFDTRPLVGATLDDLDVDALRLRHMASRDGVDDLEEFPQLESWLTQSKLGVSMNGKWTPNATAILMFGKSAQFFLPGATVEFVRYGGDDVDAPIIARKTMTGTLPEQLAAAWAVMTANLTEIPRPSLGIQSVFAPEYPIPALKELVRNMIQHRLYEGTNAPGRIEWYEDRIEMSNPGGPFGRASENEFGSHADYRNPTITEWLKNLGYVEQLGRGIRLVRKHLEKNGNPSLEVETDGFTRVIVRRVQ